MTERLNLEEVGRRAGVSRSTVSRVVNGEPNVSPDVRSRVEAVIAETGYRPNAAARSLASNRSGVIGLAAANAGTLFDDPYFGQLILGATAATNSISGTLALFLFEDEADQQAAAPRLVNSGLVDGVIVTASTIGNPLIRLLGQVNLPYVVVGRPDDDSDAPFSVDADNRGGAELAALHLATLGRRRIGLIAPPSNTTAGIDRRAGFLSGLETVGLSLDGRERAGDWSEESGWAAMNSLLDERPRPDAVFVGSDRMAVGAIRAIAEAGHRCPDDVAVVSFDGIIPANRTTPQLTSVTQPVSEVGERAVHMLNSLITDSSAGGSNPGERVVFPTELIVRQSCGA